MSTAAECLTRLRLAHERRERTRDEATRANRAFSAAETEYTEANRAWEQAKKEESRCPSPNPT